MKLLLTFFLFICFSLSGEQQFVHSGSHHFRVSSSSYLAMAKTKAVERTRDDHRSLLKSHPDTPGENDLPIFVEDDDEEDNTRKCRSSTETFTTFFYSFTNAYPRRILLNDLAVRRQPSQISSCKYITQRALRI